MHPALHYELMQTWVADLQHQAPRDALACAAHHARRAYKQRPGPRVPRPPRPAVPGRGCHRWAPRPMECPALSMLMSGNCAFTVPGAQTAAILDAACGKRRSSESRKIKIGWRTSGQAVFNAATW